MIKETVKSSLERFYEENNLPKDGGLSDSWVRYSIGKMSFTVFPNFGYRDEAIIRHDLHHVLNDIDTSNIGEGLIAAWELGAGCRNYYLNWFMESQALWFGLLREPKKTLNNFLIGRNSKSLFHGQPLEPILKMSIDNFKSEFLPKAEPRGTFLDYFLLSCYAVLGIINGIVFLPIVLFFSLMGLIFKN